MNYRWIGLSAAVCLALASLAFGGVAHSTIRPDRVITGSPDGVMGLAYMPDGKRLVSGCYDKNVRIWDVETGKLIRTFEGHTGPVRGVAVSRDGKWIASASADRTVRVWDAATGDQIAQLEGHALQARCVEFRPDGTLVSGGGEGVRLWDVKNEKLLWNVAKEGFPVQAMAVSRDGTRAAYICTDGFTRILDLVAHRQILQTGAATVRPSTTGLSPDGKTLYSDGLFGNERVRDGRFCRMELPDGKPVALPGEMERPHSFAISEDGSLALTAEDELSVWDTRTWKQLAILDAHAAGYMLQCTAISPNGKQIAAGGGGYFTADKSWYKESRNPIAIYNLPDANASQPAAPAGDISWDAIPATVRTRDGREIPLSDYYLYDDRRGEGGAIGVNKDFDLIFSAHAVLMHKGKGQLQELDAGHDAKFTDAASDGKNVWIADAEGGVVVVDPVTGQVVARVNRGQSMPQIMTDLKLAALGPDKFIAAAATKSFGGWCGLLTRDGGNLHVQTLVEADKPPQGWPGRFQPESVSVSPSRSTILVFGAPDQIAFAMLRIDANTLAVTPYNLPQTNGARSTSSGSHGPAAIGAHLWLNDASLLNQSGGVRIEKLGPNQIDKADTKRIYNSDGAGSWGFLFDDGNIVSPGALWLSVNPVSGKVRELGPGLTLDGQLLTDHVQFFTSATLGLAAVSRVEGCLFKFSIDRAHPASVRATRTLPPGRPIPPEGVIEEEANRVNFYSGKWAVAFIGGRLNQFGSGRWRIPVSDLSGQIRALRNRVSNTDVSNLGLTKAQIQLIDKATSGGNYPDNTQFEQMFAAYRAAKDEPGRQKAAAPLFAAIKEFGETQFGAQTRQLAEVQKIVTPEQWKRLTEW